MGQALDKLKKERDDATNARKELWRKEASLEKGMSSFNSDLVGVLSNRIRGPYATIAPSIQT